MQKIGGLLDGYCLREFIGPFMACIGGFTIILVSGLLFELTDLILIRRVPAAAVFRMLFYKLPGIVVLALPVGVLFGTLLALGRLVKDGELTVIRALGRSFPRIAAPFLLAGLLVSLIVFWANESIVPRSNHAYENLVRRYILQEVTPLIREQVFFKGADGCFYYIEEVDAGFLRGIFIYDPTPPARLVTAREGSIGEGYWQLVDGVLRELDDEGFVAMEIGFARLNFPVPERIDAHLTQQKSTDEMNRRELGKHIQLFAGSGVNLTPVLVDYHLKLALPLASLIFALLAAPLGTWSSGRFFGITASLIVVFAYYVLTALCRSLGINAVLPPLAAAWAPNGALAALGAYLLWRVDRI
ncbi:MAG: YjgP/YjgQ family permease [Firmicutes bacterium]|nr:YjgP/YjgQ family permease [Bacillota bacterium]